MIRTALALFLSLTLALTGFGMAVARGQGQPEVAGQIVICTGVGITTITIGPDGAPVKTIHMCPDAMMQMVATFTPPPAPLPRPVRISRAVIRPETTRLSRETLTPSARGPPQSA